MHDAISTIAAKLHVKRDNIAKWRQRGEVSHKWRLPILQEAQRVGIVIAPADFKFVPSGKKPRAKAKAKAKRERKAA